jgi:hypothetical protein
MFLSLIALVTVLIGLTQPLQPLPKDEGTTAHMSTVNRGAGADDLGLPRVRGLATLAKRATVEQLVDESGADSAVCSGDKSNRSFDVHVATPCDQISAAE